LSFGGLERTFKATLPAAYAEVFKDQGEIHFAHSEQKYGATQRRRKSTSRPALNRPEPKIGFARNILDN
jgi:hypothetical protein